MEKQIGENKYCCTKLPSGNWQGTVLKPGQKPEVITMPHGIIECKPEDVKKQIESLQEQAS